MTTNTTEIKECTNCTTNPDGSVTCEKCVTTKTTAPDYFGMIVLAVGGAIAVVIIYSLLKGGLPFGFKSTYKRREAPEERRSEERPNGSAYTR